MAITAVKQQLGKSIQDDYSSITMDIYGFDFNPRQPTGMFAGSLIQADVYLNDQTTTFDCTGFQVGHEVAAALFMIENTSGSTETGTYGFVWKKGTTTLFSSTHNYNLPNNTWTFIYSYIGVDYDEIWESGVDFKVEFYIDGSLDNTITFTVSNISIDTTIKLYGYIWVEGDYLHYIDAIKYSQSRGYEHKIDHDGSTYGSGYTAGFIRVDTTNHGRLYYIDSSGYKRRTHLADDGVGTNTGGGTELPITGATAGYIRVSNYDSGAGSYGYLCFIGYDGKGYRIMNGPV